MYKKDNNFVFFIVLAGIKKYLNLSPLRKVGYANNYKF